MTYDYDRTFYVFQISTYTHTTTTNARRKISVSVVETSLLEMAKSQRVNPGTRTRGIWSETSFLFHARAPLLSIAQKLRGVNTHQCPAYTK